MSKLIFMINSALMWRYEMLVILKPMLEEVRSHRIDNRGAALGSSYIRPPMTLDVSPRAKICISES